MVVIIPAFLFFDVFAATLFTIFTVVFGRFPIPKKRQFLKHIPSSSFVISVTFFPEAFPERRLVYVSQNKWDYRFDPYWCAFLVSDFFLIFKAFFKEKNCQHSGCLQCPREFFSFPPKTHLFGRFWPFSEAKMKFLGSKILVKTKKKTFFTVTNFLKVSIINSPQKSISLFLKRILNLCPYMRCPKSRNQDLVIFRCFLNFRPFFGPF